LKKVIIGMSGGVDSSVGAVLLKEQGFEVTGITFKLYTKCENLCCSDKSVLDAQDVCKRLDIKHFSSNYEEDFENKVVLNFIDEYTNGFTPNPCVECNRSIKFKHLIAEANKLGIDYISTGHYCNIEYIDGCFVIMEGFDSNKDQSYFLYAIKEEWLSRIIFPLGNFSKPMIREKAKKNNLERVKDKKDSYEICFINGSYKDFLKERLGEMPGDIIFYPENKIIGKHNGIYNFTVGQSRGLNIAWSHRLYVKSIHAKKNIVYVSKEEDIFAKSFLIENCNIFSIFYKRYSKESYFSVKIRHYSKKHNCRVSIIDEKTLYIVLEESVKAITPGQSAVIYQDNIVLAGGVIYN